MKLSLFTEDMILSAENLTVKNTYKHTQAPSRANE